MLVIVSDLHLCDGTAYPQNITPGSFALLLGDVYRLAGEYSAKSIDIVYLGDVFDMLRTERWFEDADGKAVALGERPWGFDGAITGKAPPEQVLARARAIVQGVIDVNHDVLAALRGEGPGIPQSTIPVRRIFLPGNHDRLYNFDPKLRDLIRGALGAVDETKLSAEGIYPHHLSMTRYGVLARHGHEWDAMNFQGFRKNAVAADYTDADFLPAPIGDPITTELVARLPYDLMKRLKADPAFAGADDQLKGIRERMEQIEDVRPLAAALHWVFYQTQSLSEKQKLSPAQTAALTRAINETVQSLARNFLSLPYFDEWFKSQHHFMHVDTPEAFKLVLDLLKVVNVDSIGRVSNAVAALIDKASGEGQDSRDAAREDLKAVGNEGLRFVVYGHTHEPVQTALHSDVTEDVYLNSGTWRKRQFFTEDKKGFIGWENYCYLVFYAADEQMAGADERKGPAFECWMGSRAR